MSRMSRLGRLASAIAVIGALLLPASNALAGGPVAQKSGAIVNYVTAGKVKVAKTMIVRFQCAVTCDAVARIALKGPGLHGSDTGSGTIPAGGVVESLIKPNGTLQKLMRSNPGKYKVVSHVTATDPATGATDTISHAFKVKR
jgi:hypothetical protein